MLLAISAHATHQRAGYITYRHISGNTYEFTIVTYTYTPSPADRPKLEISWGDGTTEEIDRTEKIDYPNDISKNTYVGTHSYDAAATYKISVEDKNRNGGVLNIPNSVNVAFYVETILVINPFLGPNSSPSLLNPPIENACVNQPFVYNPSAFDNDGDSLSYKLVFCKGEDGLNIPGYTYPIGNTFFGIDAITGDLVWDSPQFIGEYNVAFLIEEWRFGVQIGYVTVDMQILVSECNNRPPVIAPLNNLCVIAGTPIGFSVLATDPDTQPINSVTLTATGQPFLVVDNPAVFPQPATGNGSVSSFFSWQTNCSHVKKHPYSVVFKAKDNGSPVSLTDLHTVLIRIIAPAPQNLTAVPFANGINLSWNKSICDNAIGYKIYRRNGFYGYVPDSCETGVPAYTGYVQVGSTTSNSDTTWFDNNNGSGLPHGNSYCYMVIAHFFDGAESIASNEACAELPQNVPIITHVSIRNTDTQNGSAYVAWSAPKDIDPAITPGPYKYLIYRGQGLTPPALVLIDSLASLNDTVFIDTLLNTKDLTYTYKVDFYNDTPGNRFLIGSTQRASSVYLSSVGINQSVKLTWDFLAPWFNTSFTVYKQNPFTLNFDSIGATTQKFFTDTGLTNGQSYCYLIRASGNYTGTQTISPLINFSQVKCDVPVDTIPPCQPLFTVNTDCDLVQNTVTWLLTDDPCYDETTQINVYYSVMGSDDLQIVYTTTDTTQTVFVHTGLETIAGCYAVTAVDSFGNESPPIQVLCIDIDSCSLYSLPNVFTPNGDGYNDFFIPFPYKFVDKIDLQIFNRWGNIVFETNDPDINWDGKSKQTNIESSSGVYFYVCNVYERRLGGLKMRSINGFLHLLRGDADKAN